MVDNPLCCGWEGKVKEHRQWNALTFSDGLRLENISLCYGLSAGIGQIRP